MMRTVLRSAALLVVIVLMPRLGFAQSNPGLEATFRQDIGLTDDQISAIRNGQPVTKALQSRTPDEVVLFGAVYIHATPDAYASLQRDFERLRTLPNYLALGVFSKPPRLPDLNGFEFDADDIKALQQCKPGNCQVQLPASSIEELQKFDWSDPNASDKLNQTIREHALQLLLGYQRDGNAALGEYNDKRNPTLVPEQFAYMLNYSNVWPERIPDFYQYLLSYPKGKPANVDDAFYWANVKFGLKPTLRILHVATRRGAPTDDAAYVVAEKQLYANHYFQTALDLSFCIRSNDDPAGFFLVMFMSSEQAGLTGLKGSIVRKTAVGRSTTSLQRALVNIKNTLESHP